MLLPIKDVPATVTPIDVAIIIKYIGKDFQIKPKRIDQNIIYIFSN